MPPRSASSGSRTCSRPAPETVSISVSMTTRPSACQHGRQHFRQHFRQSNVEEFEEGERGCHARHLPGRELAHVPHLPRDADQKSSIYRSSVSSIYRNRPSTGVQSSIYRNRPSTGVQSSIYRSSKRGSEAATRGIFLIANLLTSRT